MLVAMPSSKGKESISVVGDNLIGSESVTDEENRLKNILSKIDGVGKVDVMISPENTGVVIVAEAAGNPVVEENIYESVLVLYDIEMHKIKIVKMSE